MLQENQPSAKIDIDNTAQRSEEAKEQEASKSPANNRVEQIRQVVTEVQRSGDISTFFIHAIAAKAGINSTDLKVLSILSRQGPLSAGHIAELTSLTTGAITFMIDRLEQAGYVQRVRHPTDRRVVLIKLIPEPLHHVTGKYFADMVTVTADAVKDYTDEQIALVIDFLRKVNTGAEKVVKSID